MKTDWTTHLHAFRRRELELALRGLPAKCFGSVLELGAGDAFQSVLLSRYALRVVSTDYTTPVPSTEAPAEVVFLTCDAEEVGSRFQGCRFDLVYSSNLLEHVNDVQSVLSGIAEVLAPGGVTIHVMPNPLWKAANLVLHVPNLLARGLDLAMRERSLRTIVGRLGGGDHSCGEDGESHATNNPKLQRPRRPLLARLFVPDPHGVSPSNLQEFKAFSRDRWLRELTHAGYEIIAVRKGPLASGYGFGFDRLRQLLERLGLCSEWIYVAKRPGTSTTYEHFLRD